MKKNYLQQNTTARYKVAFLLTLLFLAFIVPNDASAQGASCATAVSLTVNAAPVTGLANDTTVNDPTAATCITGTVAQDGWYSFSAVASNATVTVVSNNRQLVIYAYSGTCGSLTQIGCANANTSAGGQTEVMNLTGLTSGITYYVRVGNHGSGSSITLNAVSVSSPPSNDACSGAITLTSNTSCVTTNGSTFGATDNNEVGDCTTGTENAVWYQFQAVSTTHVVTVDGVTGFDPVLSVISACGSATAPSGASCMDSTFDGGIETLTLTGLTIGNYYKIQVHDWWGVSMVNGFTICVTHTLPPTITSLSAANGCVGSSLTITGTNLSSASSVTIGGTVATITSNNATSITVTVGSGTTGTVSVTTPGGTATSAATATPTFTVNPLPANPANPTSNSPQCNPPGVTLTRAASPPGTENYYWQTTSLGTSTANNSATYTATGSGTYYIRSQMISTGCWSAGQGSLAVVVDSAISSLATSPSPTTAATGVCFSGTGAISSVSWTAAAGASSYDVYFGAGSLPGSITSTVATTSYNTGALAASTTYYWKIVPRNSCGASSGTPITWTFTTGSAPCACSPTGNLSCTADDYISNVTINSLNNTTTCGAGGYTVYPASGVQTTTMVTGQAYTFSLSVGPGSGTHGAAVWFDFNQNGVYTDAGEYFLISNAITPSTTTSITVTIPAGATLGTVSMRVRYAYNVTVTSGMSCTMSGTWGETEDYTVTLIAPTPCTTPTAQPTSLSFSTLASTSISGTFTAASPAPSGYLIVRSLSATPPTPVNGTTYAVGSTALGAGTVVVQGSAVTSALTTFTDTGLTSNTRYYYHIFSYNSNCTGAPFYLTTSPLTNNAVTCPAAPTAAVNSAITTNSFTVSWTASVAGGGVGAISYTLEVYTNASYTTPIAGSPFSVGTGVTYNVTGLNGSTTYYYRIKANNGSCDSYLNGTATTTLSNDECSGAIPLSITTTCNYTTYSSIGATGSSGIPAPGCASYSTGDVWFSAVVPATGELDVDLQSGSITDSGMAFYSGTCGALTLMECDDDDSNNGAMSYISMTGLTPGQTIYIRVWDFSDGTGTFGICATTPSCPSPSDLYANILSTTSVTVNWNNTIPPASGGYQYYISNSNTPPANSATPTGSTAAGVNSVTLTGLTPGQKYYFWVRSYCGGSDTSTWFGPTNYTPCAVGNGTGTTTLACPSVTAGGLGLNGANPPAMSCQALSCVDLEATYLNVNQPTNYSVTSIPYAPPYQYTCLQNPVSVNVDDVWSPVVNLPFNFCFYGVNYNKCLIGSNGVITFNTSGTGYTPGGYSGWSFTNNLPSTSLFLNTIFGVYHDIDPSKGGQVGWELITLNTGCRALVASWNDIPMYSSTCNSQLYTGMIVLYENTNVIEVYVKEKNVCATWNDGNAVVGIQNAAGNAAIVAPNRNSTDTNWTVTNEAWRFTPTGTSLTTLKWYQGNGTSGPLLGTTGTINVCPTQTTTYTAEVTYALCSGTNLTYTGTTVVTVNGTKIWNGSQNTDWNTANNWTPSGVPTNANCVIIPVTSNNPEISAAPNAVGYNLAVYNNAQLTMNAGQNLIITDKVTVQPSGTFTLNNNANLVQINNTAVNTGNIIYKRIAPNIKGSDYVYWSSPVASQNIGTIYDGSFPYASGLKYQWNTTVNNNNGASGNIGQGNWETASGAMTMGRGYIIRGSSSFGMPASNIPTTFTGVPFNGIIPYTVQRGSYTGAPYNGANGVQITNLNDNYNLLGNPYPSSINALQFLQANAYDSSTNPTGKILGNVKLWTHGTDPLQGAPNPFYGTFQYNYDANDYLTINYLGSTTPGSVDIIRSGQAFFVQMIDGAAGSGTVNFNNSMRYDATFTPYTNSGFFRNATIVNNEFSVDRHRLWVDLVDANSQSSGILVGYASDATNDYDNLYDAPTAIPGSMKLFSTIETNPDVYEIQGRGLPFNVNDEIPIGMNAPASGNYTFAIAALDGLFEHQAVYLKDIMLNITHDLKAAPYHFTTAAGVVKDRFKIVYVNNALGVHDIDENNIKVITNTEVAVSSSNLQMESIAVFNLLGQKLNQYDNINSDYVVLSGLPKNNTTLLLKIKLQTGETIVKKISY